MSSIRSLAWFSAGVTLASALALPVVVAEGLHLTVALVCLVLGAMAVRRLPARGPWTRLVLGAVALAAGPVVAQLDVAAFSDLGLTLGDYVSAGGYIVLILAIRNILRARTMGFQAESVLDASLFTMWAALVLGFVVVRPLLERADIDGTARLQSLAYLAFSLLVAWFGLRLSLGSSSRTASFTFLLASLGLASLSEILFQIEMVTDSTLAARLAPATAVIGLTMLVASVASDGAEHLQDPVLSDLSSSRVIALAGMFATLVGAVASAWVWGPFTIAETILVLSCLAVSFGRVWLLTRSQGQWVRINVELRSAVERLMKQETPEAVAREALLAAERLLESKEYAHVDIARVDVGERAEVPQSDEDDLIAEACASGRTCRREFFFRTGRLGRGQSYGSLLAVPSPADSVHAALFVETLPLLTQEEVAHLEMLMSSYSLATEAVVLREASHDQRSKQRFRALVQDSNDIVVVADRTTLLAAFVSPTLERLLGYGEDRVLGESPVSLMHESDRRQIERQIELSAEFVDVPPIDVRVQHANGQFVWFSLSIRDLSEESEVSGLLFSFSDIHDRKMAELQLSTAEARYRALVTNSNDVLALLKDDVLAYVSPNVERIFGYPAQELVGARAESFISERRLEELVGLFDEGRLTRSGAVKEAELTTRSGEVRVVELTFADPGLDDGEYMVTIRDVSERRRLESSLRDQALHDRLTGLFNRASVYPELQRSLQRLEPGQHLGVLHLDIKDFKSINDSLGFEAGDALIVDIATRLRASLRRSDTIARLNGDEFAVVTTGDTVEEILGLVGRLEAVFDRPFELADRSVAAAVCIGAVLTENRSENATGLLEAAGLALRNAKADGTQMVVFEPWMREQAAERFELENGLIPGISRGEFFVVYQPLLNLETQQVTSTEALLRWQHPERGFVSPGVFIPLAERTGAIVQLGRWVLERACAQLRTWHDELPGGDGLSMSVNVSARQLEVPGEAARLRAIIDDSGIDPRSLILELTESVMLEDTEGLRNELEDFRSIGIRVAVDDFGTGAAGLGHLRDVPFDIVKIDKSYIDGLGESDEAHNLITGVIELAHGMRAKIVAEGIETPKQASLLRSMRCDYGQGFYLGRPMEPLQLEAWFAQGRAGAAAASIAPGNERNGRRRSDR